MPDITKLKGTIHTEWSQYHCDTETFNILIYDPLLGENKPHIAECRYSPKVGQIGILRAMNHIDTQELGD